MFLVLRYAELLRRVQLLFIQCLTHRSSHFQNGLGLFRPHSDFLSVGRTRTVGEKHDRKQQDRDGIIEVLPDIEQ